MTVIICPGIHDVALSDRFLTALNQQLTDTGIPALITPEQVLPTQRYMPFNGLSVWSFLQVAANPQEPHDTNRQAWQRWIRHMIKRHRRPQAKTPAAC